MGIVERSTIPGFVEGAHVVYSTGEDDMSDCAYLGDGEWCDERCEMLGGGVGGGECEGGAGEVEEVGF